ncbi:hypothetical protein KRX57_07145 [Weeksellaceae bacterium TAE3-ERU29]|nr:hypothetical protein [Weeksellaceae bacterium TAE3-ERU29]
MKKLITSLGLLFISVGYAQIGINKQNPQATLDISAKTDNTSDALEGLLIPRVTKNKAYLMSQNTTPPQ